MDALTVGIISNQRLIRKALFCLLLNLPVSCRLCIVVDSGTVEEAAEDIVTSDLDVLLLDVEGLDDALDCVRKVRGLSPSIKSLLLAGQFGEKFAIEAVRCGAWGIVTKQADPALLQQAIQKIVDGEMWFSHETMSMAIQTFAGSEQPKDSPLDQLTARERQVLALLARGYHNKEIASRLFLSESTVKTYIRALYRKLDVNSRLEAVLFYTDYTEVTTHPGSLSTTTPSTANECVAPEPDPLDMNSEREPHLV